MNIQQVDYIISVANLKSFGHAATHCFVTQSTLSTMVAKFEEEIGITIFDRKTKPVSVTIEGEIVLAQLKIIASELGNLKEVVQVLKGELAGELNIGVIPTVAPFILPRFLDNFVSTFPNVEFSIREITTTHIIKGIRSRDIDVGIVSIPLGNDDLIEFPLYNEEFVLYDQQNINKRQNVSLETLDYRRFWFLEDGHCFSTQVGKICELDEVKSRVDRNFKYRSGSIDGLLRFVKMNSGITLLPHLATLDFSDKEKEKISYLTEPVPARNVGLVVHKHFVKKHLLKQLQSTIQNTILPLLPAGGQQQIIRPV